MIKKNKRKLIVSSIIILLPMLLGIFGSRILPEEIIVHWGLDGKADGFMSAAAVFTILPPVLLAIHWGCMLLAAALDKNAEQNEKLMGIMIWTIPTISLFSCAIIFATALGYTSNIYAVVLFIIAAAFIVIGNYMPKTTRNVTMGIKIRWTLSNDENWNATHRFSGKVYVAAGFLSLLAVFLPSTVLPVVLLLLILACTLLPVLYSYRFYKKQIAEGTASAEDYAAGYGNLVKNKKWAAVVGVAVTVVLGIVVSVVMFTGKIEMTFGETSFTVKASFWSDLTLSYEDVDAVSYRAEGVDGERIGGIGSARLLLGSFRNDEFGVYTRYTYTGNIPCVVLTVGERTVVIGAENEQAVKEIYDRLLAEISE